MENLTEASHFITQSEVNKFLLATLLCGLIGLERELRAKQAGLKTMIMIGLGSTLFTILSVKIGFNSADRIASNIVTGIGFLGAGVIFREENRIKGLTTACVIWIVAAIGMAVGSGFHEQAIGVTILVLLSLLIFPYLENYVMHMSSTRDYRIVWNYDQEKMKTFEAYFEQFNLRMERGPQVMVDGKISGSWVVTGKPENHRKFVDYVLRDDSILEFHF